MITSQEIYTLLGFFILAVIVWGISVTPPAASFSRALQVAAGVIMVIGVVVVVVQFLTSAGIIR